MTIEYPLKNKKIDVPFGHDFTGHPVQGNFYTLFDNKPCGVDFNIDEGTKILAAYQGIVVRREFHKGMGKVLGIRNGNIVTIYAHLSKFEVGLGDIVKTGDLVGLSGWTGDACPKPHLHFEIRDLTKPTLKEMVFDPPFGSELSNFKSTFAYKVDNTNTKKTFEFLAKRYFGNAKYWKKLKESNPSLNLAPKKVLPNGTEIVTPNYH